MKLRITNDTHFSTRALRSIISAVYRQVVKEEGETLDSLRVRVSYARTWGQAHGALGFGRMSLFYRKSREPQWVQNPDGVNGRWVRSREPYRPSLSAAASTIRHELMHNLGFHHTLRSQHAERFFYDRPLPDALISKLEAKWGPTLPIHVPKAAQPVDRAQARYARVLELEKAWTRKAKLAATKLRKLRAARRRYERLSTAASPRGSADT